MKDNPHSRLVTKSTYRYLKSRCAANGVTLKSICESADVTYQVVCNWKHKDPLSIQILRSIEAKLDELDKQNRDSKVYDFTPNANA